MIVIGEDKRTIYLTRGDHTGNGNNILAVRYPVYDAETQTKTYYKFQPKDKISFVVMEKKGYDKAEVFRVEKTLEDMGYTEETEAVEIMLTSIETKAFDVLNKKKTYWYDIVLNDEVTIIGYNEEYGAAKLICFPEAREKDGQDLEALTIIPSTKKQTFMLGGYKIVVEPFEHSYDEETKTLNLINGGGIEI